MQGRQRRFRELAHQREMEMINVKMQHVEFGDPAAQLFQHQHMIGQRIEHLRIEAQRLFAARHQLRRGSRVATGEQRHVVALTDQLFGQIGDDPFGAAVEPGWHAFVEGRDLGDFHRQDLLGRAKHRQ